MTREEFIKKYEDDCSYYFDGYYSCCIDDFLTNIYNDHEAELKEVSRVKEDFRKVVLDLDEELKAKDEEIERLKAGIKQWKKNFLEA